MYGNDPGVPAQFVLELNGGDSDSYGIATGDRIKPQTLLVAPKR